MNLVTSQESVTVAAEGHFAEDPKNVVFWEVFSRLPVFTILFEDTDVDDAYFEVDEDSRILAVSAAGCGLAGHLARNPRRIDAVDGNPHHLALAALKIEGARKLASLDDLYALFGLGRHAEAERVVTEICQDLPPWIQRYWRSRHRVFQRGLHRSRLFGQLFRVVQLLAKSEPQNLRAVAGRPLAEREAYLKDLFATFLRWPGAKAACRSPLVLLAQGINFRQRDRNLASHATADMLDVMWDFMRRFADADVERNWILWHCVVGEFDHANPDCRPPYLRESHHQRSVGASTSVAYHLASFLDVMRAAPGRTWSHYNFSDALDWLSDDVQRQVLAEVGRTALPGATLINRSVDQADPIERLGLGERFERLVPASTLATAAERSCLYRRTDLYRVRA